MAEISLGTDPASLYPICLALAPELGNQLAGRQMHADPPEGGRLLSEYLADHPEHCEAIPYLYDLARIEEAAFRLQTQPKELPERPAARMVNPALELLQVDWRFLPEFISDRRQEPCPGTCHVLLVIPPGGESVEIRSAGSRELLALKITAEGIDSRAAAAEGGVSVGAIDDLLSWAVQQGLLISPPSRIRRPPDFPRGEIADPEVFASPTFTLQWHVTQACDLNCRHCYDRSSRQEMPLSRGLSVLDDLYDFCRSHSVFGQVSFSGGNPLLYPYFDRLYREASERGFMTAVLGNPMPKRRIEKLRSIQIPEFYQVSLEGTREHNDYIRGQGHFDRTMKFLSTLGELGIYRMVMLTLTRDNMDQVLELADQLRGRAELFTFNRLAAVGQGAFLSPVPPEDFPAFLGRYMKAAAANPCLGLKDNLFNLLRYQQGMKTGGGCTGHGCGAAFNFLALLPDGEVHACRKLPSYMGNIYAQPLTEIYHGEAGRRFRAGSSACSGCPVRPVCGSCLAVSHGSGLDIFRDPDPCCFR
jgi:selenobiotic family peptide radical SAM maturase